MYLFQLMGCHRLYLEYDHLTKLIRNMEGYVRVFAAEYNGSSLSVPDKDSSTPSWVITPGGAWCRSLFLSGALTEATESGDMVYSRISDPTGAFDLVIGGRNTPLAEIFCTIPIPSFVTVSGRAQMYMKSGIAHLSVRPDHIRIVNRSIRDQWVLATAKATLIRLNRINQALMNSCSESAILIPVRHYPITRTSLRKLAAMVEDAVRTVPSPGNNASLQTDVRTRVMEIISSGSGPRGISVEEIIRLSMESGIPREAVIAAIESLVTEDECYQPQKGFVKPL
jgi:uncharacterized protein